MASKRWVAAVIVLALTACASPHANEARNESARDEVAAAMERYQVAMRALDLDALASFFTEDALMFEPGIQPVQSRASIRALLGSFPGVRVERANVTADAIEVFGDTALYWGDFDERLAFPGQPVSDQQGKFVAEWTRQADGTWLIRRLLRVPVTTQTSPQ